MKPHLKAGLFFSISMFVFLVLLDIYKLEHAGAEAFVKIFIFCAMEAAVAGLLFGFIINKFSKSKAVQITVQLREGESLVFETNANHFKGIEAVGGKLVLTNQRLLFSSHQFNIQNHKWSLAIAEISRVNSYKSLGLINNGLEITTRYGKKEKFVVDKLQDWLRLLPGAR